MTTTTTRPIHKLIPSSKTHGLPRTYCGVRPYRNGVRAGEAYGEPTCKACLRAERKDAKRERVKVQVEYRWGYKWNGSHFEETKDEGVHCSVMEHYSNRQTGGYSFKGCPLGRTTGWHMDSDDQALAFALKDFVMYGKPEYLGTVPLTVDMLEIVEVRDLRKGE